MDFKELIPGRYRVSYDTKTGSFWILDTWHESVKNIQNLEDAVIPENSPALVILTQEQANALIGEQIKLGWFNNMKTTSPERVNAINSASIERPTSIQEIAINKIAEIVKVDSLKDDVAKEAIMAMRELGTQK